MAHMLALTLAGNLIVGLFILVCIALILIILLQKGRGGGLGAAFGGGGAGSLLGTKTGDFLTWVTISLVAGFLVLAVLMGKFMRPSGVSPELSGVVPTTVDGTTAADIETPDEAADTAAEVEVTEEAATEAAEAVDTEAAETVPEAADAETTE